ncbi:MAG: formate C-acetyltransferase/glycerol dehydratase family glycyl radical enzyme [Candidatus Atribacteria bacterium]|nr:formate C-acetyltransferase/glycerol dehydratase family glycyl radical enzyme [Candidatus Atribacteria bacterium]
MSIELNFQLEVNPEYSERILQLLNFVRDSKPGICIERARFITQSYKETEAFPIMIRRAMALEKILKNMTISVFPGSLLVGNQAQKPRWAPIFPEFAVGWLRKEIFEKDPYYPPDRPADPFIIEKEYLEELKEIFDWWTGKTHMDRVYALLHPEIRVAQDEVGVVNEMNYMQGGDGHFSPDHKWLIDHGLNEIIQICEIQLKKLNITDPSYYEKREFYESVSIACRAVIHFAERYAKLCEEMAFKEENEVRKKELLDMAEICRNVPANPAKSFHEALQFTFFIQLVLQIEDNAQGISVGRFDRIFWNHYKRDIEAGLLNKEKALELTENFYIMLYTVNRIKSWGDTDFFRGSPMFQNLTIGGIDPITGEDITNDLTYIALEATANTRLTQPSLTARIHPRSPEKYKMKVCEVIRLGTGYPAVFNDDAYITALNNRGYSLEDASDYCIIGCAEAGPAGLLGGRTGGAWLNLTKILELTLNNGFDPRSKNQLKRNTNNKTLSEFESFDELWKTWLENVDYYIDVEMTIENLVDDLFARYLEEPLAAAFGCPTTCLIRGVPMKKGGAKYDFTGQQTIGVANVANSLYAIKELVFNKKKLTGNELLYALKTDFSDQTTSPSGEEIRQMCLGLPKYGNDNDDVDSIARDVLAYICENQVKHKNSRYGKGPIGGFLHTSTTTVSSNTPFGRFCGATPDGRKAFTPVADGQSPMRGTDIAGPTAAVKSVAKLRQKLLSCGSLYNLKLVPEDLKGEQGLQRLLWLIEYYFSMGGMQMQFNVVGKKTLLDAQKQPDLYRNLLVRVAGYSAYFVTLEKTVQMDIIERTEERLG